jgi:peptidoglycan/xylan/chitin deacetylase (PgdA/CDA1 family)/ketosteroid isomerase-like protein
LEAAFIPVPATTPDRSPILIAACWLALALPAAAQDFPTVQGAHPLLVTVDDLPIGNGRMHVDAAARERVTRDILAVLRKHKVPAVGLVTWGNVHGPADEALLDLWLKDGHELGNHAFTHPDYSRTEPDAYVADMEKARATLSAFLEARGRRLRFFRFPFLREGDTPAKLTRMREWLRATGQRNLPVTIDDQDWSFEEPWVTATRAGDAARLARLAEDYQHALRLESLVYTAAGDALFERPTPQILLVHANAVGAAQWDALFTWLVGRGFRFASADEVLADPAFAEPHEYVGRYGGSLWDRLRHVRRQARARDQVRALLKRQADDWNRGDLEAFCSAYDDDAAFVAADGLTRGRAAVLDRYRRRYPDRAAMGTLTLEVVELRDVWGPEVTPLGDATPGAIHGASVVARWSLRREGAPPAQGHTLLVLRRTGDAWRIVQDASM